MNYQLRVYVNGKLEESRDAPEAETVLKRYREILVEWPIDWNHVHWSVMVFAQPKPFPERSWPIASYQHSPPDTNDAKPDGLGLSIDMLDVDRLREWARNISAHGPNISHWSNAGFVSTWLIRFADRVEQAIRDIGVLRGPKA